MIISLHLGGSLWRCVALPVAMGLHGLDGRILGLTVCALVDLSTSSLVKPPISIQTKTQTTLLTFVLLLSMDFHKMLSKFLNISKKHIKLITRTQAVFYIQKKHVFITDYTKLSSKIHLVHGLRLGRGDINYSTGISSLYSQT